MDMGHPRVNNGKSFFQFEVWYWEGLCSTENMWIVPKWSIPVSRVSPQKCAMWFVRSEGLSSMSKSTMTCRQTVMCLEVCNNSSASIMAMLTLVSRVAFSCATGDTYNFMLLCNFFMKSCLHREGVLPVRDIWTNFFCKVFCWWTKKAFIHQLGSLISLICRAVSRAFISVANLPCRSLPQKLCWLQLNFLTYSALQAMYNYISKRIQLSFSIEMQ